MRILIVKTSALGDLIHIFPVLSYLKKRFPLSQIDWVVEAPFAELVKAHPDVSDVLTIESKKWRKAPLVYREELGNFRSILRQKAYDIAFDLQGNIKSGVILSQVRAKDKVGFGWKTVAEWPNTLFTSAKINPPRGKNIREDYLAVVKNYFKDTTPFKSEPIALHLTKIQQIQVDEVLSDATMVCPGSAWPNKQLPLAHLVHFLKKLGEERYLFIWGTEEEKENAIYLASHFTSSLILERCALPVLQHIMAKCRLVIAMDSLPLHLCATTKTPTLSFFGPSSAKKYGPIGAQHKTFQGECPYGVVFEKRCPKLRTCKTGACINKFDQEYMR